MMLGNTPWPHSYQVKTPGVSQALVEERWKEWNGAVRTEQPRKIRVEKPEQINVNAKDDSLC